VGDRTGSVCFSLWNEQAEAIEAGDILKLTRGLIQSCHNLLSTWGGLIFEPYFLPGLTVCLSNEQCSYGLTVRLSYEQCSYGLTVRLSNEQCSYGLTVCLSNEQCSYGPTSVRPLQYNSLFLIAIVGAPVCGWVVSIIITLVIESGMYTSPVVSIQHFLVAIYNVLSRCCSAGRHQ